MDNKSDENFLIFQSTIEANKQESYDKINKLTEDLKSMITSTITSTMGQMKNSKSSPDHNYSPNPEYPTTVVPANMRYAPLYGGHSMKIGVVWTLKHDIRSPKLYPHQDITQIRRCSGPQELLQPHQYLFQCG